MPSRPTTLSIVLLSVLACRPSAPDTTAPPDATPEPEQPVEEPPVEEPPVEEPPVEEPPDVPSKVEPGKKYDFVVSFFSPGNGTDHEAADRLRTAIAGFTGVVHSRGQWGKEGEHDECFELDALSVKDRAAFLEKAKAAVAASKRVNVKTDAECQDRGL